MSSESSIVSASSGGEALPQKAGLLLFGKLKEDPETLYASLSHAPILMLANFTEGRFGDRDKYYGIPKGSIDEGESPIVAAIRETAEETGVDLHALLGDKNYQKFISGEKLENLPTTVEGVRVVCADPTPIHHRYMSLIGRENDATYYKIQLEGIEHLRGALKGAAYADWKIPHIKKGETAHEVAQQKGFPKFRELLNGFRTGVMPATKVTFRDGTCKTDAPCRVIEDPILPSLEERYGKVDAVQIEGKPHAHLPEKWMAFLSKLTLEERKQVDAQADLFKEEYKKRGLLCDAQSRVKLDSKDRYLMMYQEGAEILPVDILLKRATSLAEKNPLYAQAMWGDYVGPERPHATDEERFASAQILPLVDVLKEVDRMVVVSATVPKDVCKKTSPEAVPLPGKLVHAVKRAVGPLQVADSHAMGAGGFASAGRM